MTRPSLDPPRPPRVKLYAFLGRSPHPQWYVFQLLAAPPVLSLVRPPAGRRAAAVSCGCREYRRVDAKHCSVVRARSLVFYLLLVRARSREGSCFLLAVGTFHDPVRCSMIPVPVRPSSITLRFRSYSSYDPLAATGCCPLSYDAFSSTSFRSIDCVLVGYLRVRSRPRRSTVILI